MAWGDIGSTKKLYKQDSVTNWGAINTPKTVQMLKQGIIQNLRMIQGGGALAFAGATSASKMGPYNAYTLLHLLGNSQQDIFRTSGYGMYLINCLLNGLEDHSGPPNSAGAGPINATDPDFVFDGQAITAPATNTQWNWHLDMPVAQKIRSLGGDIGMIPMATENAQLAFEFTATAASVSGSTYTMNSSSDDLSQPYYGANAVTIASPSLDLVRIMYEAVINEQDMPDFDWINQWIEETPQTYSGTAFTWKQNQDAGLLLRLIWGIFTSASPWGITTDKLTAANSFQLSYNTDTAKFKESGLEAVARQREQLGGRDFPLGCFFYDMLGSDLTMFDVLDSYKIPAIQLNASYTSVTLNTTVTPKVIAQRLLPIRTV